MQQGIYVFPNPFRGFHERASSSEPRGEGNRFGIILRGHKHAMVVIGIIPLDNSGPLHSVVVPQM